MFLITWVFDKLGYMPKISVDTAWSFHEIQKNYVAPDVETKPAVKKVAKKSAKIPQATTRKTPKK